MPKYMSSRLHPYKVEICLLEKYFVANLKMDRFKIFAIISLWIEDGIKMIGLFSGIKDNIPIGKKVIYDF